MGAFFCFLYLHMSFYKTIENTSEGFYKEKGSKFFAFAIPCTRKEEVKVHINRLRKEHHLAVHVCSAFRLGSDKKLFRSSDDGEPSNSAGPPILGQIVSYDLTNVLIAIVRYYGGTNLGVGGLIHAYRTAAKEAIENAVIIEKEDQAILQLTFPYDCMPQVMKLIKKYAIATNNQVFDTTCKLEANVPVSKSAFTNEITSIESLEVVIES